IGRLFFFFQAEDGIRDLIVTGVQTCALPIFFDALQRLRTRLLQFSSILVPARAQALQSVEDWTNTVLVPVPPGATTRRVRADNRSEERRVGKECRGRWLPSPCKITKAAGVSG